MSAALIAAFFFSGTLLVTHALFLLGSVPLLILKHDTPMDGRFVRGFFNAFYLAAIFAASGTALSLSLAGRSTLAAGAAGLALLAAVLRWNVIPKMDSLRAQFQVSDKGSISAFRRVHAAAILINLAQLVVIVWALIATSLQSRAGAF